MNRVYNYVTSNILSELAAQISAYPWFIVNKHLLLFLSSGLLF